MDGTGPLLAKALVNVVGHLADGTPIKAVALRNRYGTSATILTFGGTLQSLRAQDRDGRFADIVLGHRDPSAYWQAPSAYLGSTIGRFANRIDGGRLVLDGQVHKLQANEGAHALHGGEHGFHARLWTIETIAPDQASVTLGVVSPDGDSGHRGTMTVKATWTLDDDNALTITFEATTTRPTVVNLTNHAFFNLAGSGSALDQVLTLHADAYTPIREGLIPTGEIHPLAGTAFDFRQPMAIRSRLHDIDDQLALAQGYDHNFVVRGERGTLRPAARLDHPVSGRRLEVWTTEPGIQFYSGNFLDGSLTGRDGHPIERGDGICLEPQTFPDAPNQPAFPSARLDPGDTYRHTLSFRLSVID